MAGNPSSTSSCHAAIQATSNGLFEGENPLDFPLPLAILQICLVVALTRILAFLLRPLRQPRVIAEIIGGILLGPSALGRNKKYLNAVFPSRSLTVLDTLANLGLLFFVFLVGLELDLKSLRMTGKKAFAIAVAGISLPFVLGIGTSFALCSTISKGVSEAPFLVFMGVALSITAFPVLARIVVELKLLTTDVGQMALSAAAVNDVAAWILLALAIALSGNDHSPLVSLWVLLCGSGFLLCCIFVVPPIFRWMSQRCPEVEPVEELHVCATLVAVLAAGFVTDAIGIHALFGAFVIGVLVPKEGPFAGALVEKVEDLVCGLFLPLYFVSSGLKTNVATIQGAQSWGLLVLVITTACLGKIVGTVTVSLICGVQFQEALVLGLLMNTKGLVELIVLNIGKNKKVLNDQTFAIMVLMAIFTTFITTPLVLAAYKSARRTSRVDYKYKTIERKDPKTQLRILTCLYGTRNIPTIINLIEASRGTDRREGLRVYVLRPMELSDRSSAILTVHKARKNGLQFWNKGKPSDCDQAVVAFEAFRQLSTVSIHPMTAISPIPTIHEDICASAENKKVAMIILPFHEHQRLDGALETTRTEFPLVNKKVLDQAPCSVGILVDRGLGGTTHISASNVSSTITVLFFGGHDDCEALAYGLRMVEHPGISLTVIHFLPSPEISGETVSEEIKSSTISIPTVLKEKIPSNGSINYKEKEVRNAAQTMETAKEFSQCNLFLVGRTPVGEVAEKLNVESDCPELGPVGSMLTSPEFSTSASVLVVQQYNNNSPPALLPPLTSVKVEEVPEEDPKPVLLASPRLNGQHHVIASQPDDMIKFE